MFWKSRVALPNVYFKALETRSLQGTDKQAGKRGLWFFCSYVSSHDARARWMNTMHHFGALNMQSGDMLDIWSWSKMLLMCHIDTQLPKCPQRVGLCFSGVQSTCWGSKKSKPMHNISAPLESPMKSAFLTGRWTSFGCTPNSFFNQKIRQLVLSFVMHGVPLILQYWDSTTMPTLSLSAAWAVWSVPLAAIVAFPDCNEEVSCVKRETWSWTARCWSLPCSKAFGLVFWCHLTLDVA